MTPAERRFRVFPRHETGECVRVVTEASFEAAAIAFVEDYAPAQVDGSVAIQVLDLDTGVEHCFLIDLETGATSPCAE